MVHPGSIILALWLHDSSNPSWRAAPDTFHHATFSPIEEDIFIPRDSENSLILSPSGVICHTYCHFAIFSAFFWASVSSTLSRVSALRPSEVRSELIVTNVVSRTVFCAVVIVCISDCVSFGNIFQTSPRVRGILKYANPSCSTVSSLYVPTSGVGNVACICIPVLRYPDPSRYLDGNSYFRTSPFGSVT